MRDATEKMSQEFTTTSGDNKLLKRVFFTANAIGGTGSPDTATVSIHSSRTGVALYTTNNIEILSTSDTIIVAYFEGVVLEPSTTYYIIFNWIGGDTFMIKGNNSSGVGFSVSDDSGSSWTNVINKSINVNLIYDGRTYFKIPSDGKYIINFNLSSGEAGTKKIKIYKNETAIINMETFSTTSGWSQATFSTIYDLSIGDFVYPTVNASSSDSDDVKSLGSSLNNKIR